MRAVRQALTLLKATLSLWWRRLPLLGFWLCVGWSARELLTVAGALIGNNIIPALLIFTLSLVVWVIALILMLHSVTSEMACLSRVTDDQVLPPVKKYSAQEVIVEAAIPFLAAYAAWGFTQDYVRQAFSANIIFQNDPTKFSLSFSHWRLYVLVAVIVWILQQLLARLVKNRGGLPMALLATYLKGAALLTVFLGISEMVTVGKNWFLGRKLWAWAQQAWQQAISWLPDWRNWWQSFVSPSIERQLEEAWNQLVPGLFNFVLMPLVWLAITAIVVGWSDFKTGIAPSGLTNRINTKAEQVRQTRIGGALWQATDRTTLAMNRAHIDPFDNLRPAVQAFRLIIRSGPLFLGIYLLLGALVRLLAPWTNYVLMWLIGPGQFEDQILYLPLVQFIAEFLGWTLAVSFYASAFDHAMLQAMDTRRANIAVGDPAAQLKDEYAPRRLLTDSQDSR